MCSSHYSQVHLSPSLYWLFVYLIQNWGVVCKPFKDIVTGLRYLPILRSVLIDKLKYKVYQKSNQVQSISKYDLEPILFQFFLAFELMLNMNAGLRNSSSRSSQLDDGFRSVWLYFRRWKQQKRTRDKCSLIIQNKQSLRLYQKISFPGMSLFRSS